MNLREKRAAALAKARKYQMRIKGGESLTDEEVSEVKSLLAEVEALDIQISKADEAAGTLAKLGALAPGQEEVPTGNSGDGAVKKSGRASIRRFKAGRLGANLYGVMSPKFGMKGLAESGSALTEVPLVSADPLVLPQAPASILEVLRFEVRTAPTFEYLRQTARDIEAAFVPAGEQKPVSTLKVERVQGQLQVLATVSEPLDKYLLADNVSLEAFVQGQLAEGLQHALEYEIIHGAGGTYTPDGSTATYQHLTGLLATSGIQTLTATDTDKAVVLREAIDLLEDEGHAASVYMMNPEDWRTIETTRNTSGQFDLGGIATRSARTLWSVPVVTSAQVDAGTALCLDTTALTIDTDGSLNVEWDKSGDLFAANQVRARVEGRFGLSVYRPAGIVKVTLTPAP